MSEHIPAWKRAGLSQQKSKASYDPVTAGLKRSESGEQTGPKKPPKRVKVPKAERKPPPESDQLAYLRQYHEDRDNWKFSKQKQNWILKNIFTIDEKYQDALVEYVASIQGASKQRVLEDCEKLITEWNEYMTKEGGPKSTETTETNEENATTESHDHESETKEDKGEAAPASAEPKTKTDAEPKGILKNKQNAAPPAESEEPAPPKEFTAVRAQKIVEAITGTKPTLEYVE